MAAGQSDIQIIGWMQRPKLDRTTLWRFRKNRLPDKLQRASQGPATVVQVLQQKGLLKDSAEVNEQVKAVVAATAAVAAVDPFIARVEKLRADRERVKGIALSGDKPDLRTWSALDRNDLSELELHARLAGRLDTQASDKVNVAIALYIPRGTQETDDGSGPVVDVEPIK